MLAASLALAIAPGGFTVADLTAKVRAMTGQAGYTVRNAAYDLRKLRGKHLAVRRTPFGPNRTRRQPWPSSSPAQALSGREAFSASRLRCSVTGGDRGLRPPSWPTALRQMGAAL